MIKTLRQVLDEIINTFRYLFIVLFIKREQLKTQGKNGPVVGVHGLFGVWQKRGFYKYLKNNKVKAILVNNGLQIKTVDEYVEKLQKVITKNSLINPIIVGYSMGGVVALRYAQKHKWRNVKKVITIGAPLKGTKAAYFFPFLSAARDLTPKSKVIKDIQKGRIVKRKLINVYSDWDQVINKKSMVLFNGEKEHVGIGGHSTIIKIEHLEKIFDKHILEKNDNTGY